MSRPDECRIRTFFGNLRPFALFCANVRPFCAYFALVCAFCARFGKPTPAVLMEQCGRTKLMLESEKYARKQKKVEQCYYFPIYVSNRGGGRNKSSDG